MKFITTWLHLAAIALVHTPGASAEVMSSALMMGAAVGPRAPHVLFTTLAEAHIRRSINSTASAGCDLMQTVSAPEVVLLGGGVAVGKSTAGRSFLLTLWPAARVQCFVYVSADDFKFPELRGVIARDELHRVSTKAAEDMFVRALNARRDVVFDGTMQWPPFVQQVVAAVRRAHLSLNVCAADADRDAEVYFVESSPRRAQLVPYHSTLIGVFIADNKSALQRARRRKIATGRDVPMADVSRSAARFAANFSAYVGLVDQAFLLENSWRDAPATKSAAAATIVAVKRNDDRALRVSKRELYDSFVA